MDKQQISNHLRILLQNHPEEHSAIIILHSKEHQTQLAIRCNEGFPCESMIVLEALISNILKQLQSE